MDNLEDLMLAVINAVDDANALEEGDKLIIELADDTYKWTLIKDGDMTIQ